MILLTASDIRKYFSQDPVLDGACFQISTGERVALVGPNGSGKTTLLNIISGQLEVDGGELEIHGSCSIAFLPQRPDFSAGTTLWDLAMAPLEPIREMARRAEQLAGEIAKSEHPQGRQPLEKEFDLLEHRLRELDGYHLDHRVERVLDGLGFDPASYQQPVEQLSGGQQNRLLLARRSHDPREHHALAVDGSTQRDSGGESRALPARSGSTLPDSRRARRLSPNGGRKREERRARAAC